MLIQPEQISKKPYLSYAMVQGQERETIVVKGHLSMRAAERASKVSMADLREQHEAVPGRVNVILMAWGYMKVEDHERQLGIVV